MKILDARHRQLDGALEVTAEVTDAEMCMIEEGRCCGVSMWFTAPVARPRPWWHGPLRWLIGAVLCILYIVVAVALVGLSVWWFQETDGCENPVLMLLCGIVRLAPGVVGAGMFLGLIAVFDAVGTEVVDCVWSFGARVRRRVRRR